MNNIQFSILIESGEVKKITESKFMDYYVSKSGNVYSLKKKTGVIHQVKPYKNKNGYERVLISKKWYSVHRMVAQAFIPNPENKPEVNHISGKSNNVENLEWNTRKENMNHAWSTGLMENNRRAERRNREYTEEQKEFYRSNMSKVSKEHRRKFTDDQVREMRKLYETGEANQPELAKKFNISKASISLIINKKRYPDVI